MGLVFVGKAFRSHFHHVGPAAPAPHQAVSGAQRGAGYYRAFAAFAQQLASRRGKVSKDTRLQPPGDPAREQVWREGDRWRRLVKEAPTILELLSGERA